MTAPLNTIQEVVRELQARGFDATLEYPGYVSVQLPLLHQWAAFGTANGKWDGDLENSQGIVIDAVPVATELSGDSTDVTAIADLITEAMRTVTLGTRS